MFRKCILFPLFLAMIVDNPVAICVKPPGERQSSRVPYLGVNFRGRSISKKGRQSSRSATRQSSRIESFSSDSSDEGDYPSAREFQRMANAFIRFNREEAARINYNMNLLELLRIRESMTALASNDQCSTFNFGRRTGRSNCIVAFREFKTIPVHLRGPACSGAYLAACCRLAPGLPKTCAFFVKTSPGETSPVHGHWKHIQLCANDIRMDALQGTIFGNSQMHMELGRK